MPTLDRLTMLLVIKPFLDSPKKSRESLCGGEVKGEATGDGEGVETTDADAEISGEGVSARMTLPSCVCVMFVCFCVFVCGGRLQPLMGLVATSILTGSFCSCCVLWLFAWGFFFSELPTKLSDVDSHLLRRSSADLIRSHAFPRIIIPFNTLKKKKDLFYTIYYISYTHTSLFIICTHTTKLSQYPYSHGCHYYQ